MRRLLPAALALAAFAGPAAAQRSPAPRPQAPTAPAAPTPPTPTASFDDEVGKLLGQAGGLTADQAAARAKKASPTVRRKTAEVEELRTGLSSITVALVPLTTVSAGYTRLSYLDPPTLGGGIPFPIFQNSYHLGAQVAMPLTKLFIYLPTLKRATELGVTAATISRHASELSAAAGARVAYYEWVRAELQVIVAGRLLVQVTGNLDRVRALAEAQRVSKADVLRLEALRAQAELAVAQVGQLVALRGEQLRIAIGAGPDEPLVIGEDVRVAGTDEAVAANAVLLRTALQQRLELGALDAAAAALGQQRKAERADRLPQLDVFAQGVYDNPNQRVFPAEDKFTFTWAAGAKLSWSLNDFLHVGPNDAKLAAQERALAADRAGLELGIRGEITAARQAVLLADAALAATEQGLVAAEESYRVRQELLAAERATALELVDAETELTRARIASIDALIDRRIARTRLHHVTGNDVR